jgi:hypothetical protein
MGGVPLPLNANNPAAVAAARPISTGHSDGRFIRHVRGIGADTARQERDPRPWSFSYGGRTARVR